MGEKRGPRAKRICHVVQSYYPRDPRIRRQAEALVEAGFHVDVVCLRDRGETRRETVNGVHVTRVPLSRQRGGVMRYVFEYAAFFFLASSVMLLRSRKYSVVHVSNMPDFLVFTALAPKLFGTRVLLDEHDLFPELFMAKYGFQERHRVIRFLRWQERRSLRFAHHILTTTQLFKEHYEQMKRRAPVSVVMNLPDEKLFRPIQDYPNNRRDSKEFVLLYAGTISHIYSLDLTVRAIADLVESIPSIRFRMAGDGEDIPRLRALAEELRIADRVEFLGVVPFSKVPELIAESDLGISTLKLDPLTDKCFNNKAGEYVAMGLPTISTRTSAIQQHFPSHVVRLVEPGDVESLKRAVLDLYRDSELRKRMSRDGLDFTKTANWSTEKVKYVQLITDLSQRE